MKLKVKDFEPYMKCEWKTLLELRYQSLPHTEPGAKMAGQSAAVNWIYGCFQSAVCGLRLNGCVVRKTQRWHIHIFI